MRCLIKPLFKNITQIIFQGGTPWVTEILNNVIVSMVLYCAQKLLGWNQKRIWKENQLKVDWCQLKSLLKLTILKTVEGGRLKWLFIQ